MGGNMVGKSKFVYSFGDMVFCVLFQLYLSVIFLFYNFLEINLKLGILHRKKNGGRPVSKILNLGYWDGWNMVDESKFV